MKTTHTTPLTSLRGIVKDDDFKKLHLFSFTGKRDSHPHRVQTFKCIDKIFWKNEETGETRERIIRLIEGERSIFEDEQDMTNNMTEKNQIDRRIFRMKVQGNTYTIAGNNINHLAYMRLCNANGSNEKRDMSKEIKFFEFMPEKAAKQNLEKQGDSIKARYKAYQELSIEEVKAVLVAVSTDSAEYGKILNSKKADELRHDAVVLATNNPAKFLEVLESPSMKYKYLLCKAVAMMIIKVSEGGTHLTWNDGGLLFECNLGKNVLDEVALRYAGGDERCTQIFKEVKMRLDAFFPNGAIEKQEEMMIKTSTVAPPKDSVVAELPKSIYDRLKTFGQLKHIGIKIQVKDKEWDNIGVFLKGLKENKELYDEMKFLAGQAEIAYKQSVQR